MKTKHFLLTLLLASFASGTLGQYRYNVTNKSEFTDALAQIATLPKGSAAYIYISGDVNAGTLNNDNSGIMQPTLRNIHLIGVDDENGNKATLRMEMRIPAGNTEADGFSLHYENLKLQQTQGIWGNSKHLMNFKDANKHYIDTLEFINCELTELCRSIYRGEVSGAGKDFTGAGTLKVFRMENCVVHNGFRQSNAFPAIYIAQPVNEMTFRNNTFYDLTYLNGLVCFGNVSENAGRQAVKVTFENNTICAWSKSSLLSFANGVSSDSEFHIKNNIILQPTWADDMNGRFGDSKDNHGNMGIGTVTDFQGIYTADADGNTNGILPEEAIAARIEKGVVLTNLDGGFVQLENNMLYGYRYQNLANAIEAGDIIPIGDNKNEEKRFNFLSMEDVPFAWTDFADPQNDNFQINAGNPAYKAGKNGASLGDINNYAMEDLPTTQPQHSLQMLVFHHRNGTKMEMDLDKKPSVKLMDDQMVVALSDGSRKFIKEDIQRITYKYNKYDVNGDNATDVADIATIISVMSGVGIGSDLARNADVNRDGAVDVADIAAIISAMAGNGSSSRSTTSFRGKNDEASGGIIAYGKETICFDDTNLICISHDSPETGEITFTCQDTIIYRSIYDVDSIVFSAAFENIQYEYRILDKESDGMDAIITSTGDFCLIKDDIELRNDSLIAIWGNVNDNEYNYAIIDSLGFINTIIIKDKVYSIIYGNDSITILRDNDWLCNISYDNLKNEEISSSRRLLTPMRASWLTRNPVYKTLCVIDNILGWVEDSSKQLFLYYLRHYGMGNQDINNFLADSSGFIGKVDWLKLIEWLDNLFDYYYFGDNSVKTLDPVKIKPCNYNLPCQVTISLKDTPYYKAMAAHGVSYSLSLTMNLKDKSIGGKSQPKTEHLLDKDIISFNYPNLDIDTYYSYEPRLDVEYQISYKAYFLSIGIPENKLKPQIVKHSRYGEEKEFFTGTIGCSVGEATNIKAKSADIECTYSNIPEGATCGIKVIRNKDKEERFVSNGSSDGKRTAKATGLDPATEYAYIGCVKYKGKEYLSWNAGSFTTLYPSCSTGEVVSKTQTSAVVNCSYDGAEGFECGVMVSSDNGTKKYPTSSNDGERPINITGLTPSTTYNYWAYMEINGVPTNGAVKTFTTKPASLAGTWSCSASGDGWTASFTIIMNEDGSASATNSSGTEYTGSWSLNADGQAYVGLSYYSWWDYHSFHYNFYGKVDNLLNPSKIEGEGTSCSGTGVSYSAEYPLTFVMTK